MILAIHITNTFNKFTMPLLGISIASGIIIFFLVTRYLTIKHEYKLKQVERLIREGHEKAVRGKRNDGIYRETRREKTHASINI